MPPASEAATWDAIRGEYLAQVFAMAPVNALGLGTRNGELLRSIEAFSPGFIPAVGGPATNTKPRIFISHGTRDGE